MTIFSSWTGAQKRHLRGFMRASADGERHFLDAQAFAARIIEALHERAFVHDLGEFVGVAMTLGELRVAVVPASDNPEVFGDEAIEEIERVIKAQCSMLPEGRVQAGLSLRVPRGWLVYGRVPRRLATSPDRVDVRVFAVTDDIETLREFGLLPRLLRELKASIRTVGVDAATVERVPAFEVEALAAAQFRADVARIVAAGLYNKLTEGKDPAAIAERDREVEDLRRGHRHDAITSGLIAGYEEDDEEGETADGAAGAA